MTSMNDYTPKLEADKAVAERFGYNRYVERLRFENERELKLNGKVRWCPVPFISFIFRFLFKLFGLWKKGYREYLSPVVENHDFFIKDLPKEFDGFSILHLSDLHLDLDSNIVDVIKRTVAPLKYDICVITGDFNNLTVHKSGSAMTEMSQVRESLGENVYAVLGNHDSLLDVPFLEEMGIRVLLNENIIIKRDSASLCIAGVDDANIYKSDDVEKAFLGVANDVKKILLSHSPCVHEKAANANVDLVLSGHIHGGQICFKNGEMIHRVFRLRNDISPYRVWKGRWRENNTQGWTSRGIGACGVPLRMNCPPEVSIHTLHCAEEL